MSRRSGSGVRCAETLTSRIVTGKSEFRNGRRTSVPDWSFANKQRTNPGRRLRVRYFAGVAAGALTAAGAGFSEHIAQWRPAK